VSGFWKTIASTIESVALPESHWMILLLPVIALVLAVAIRTRPDAFTWPGLDEARAAGARRFDAWRGAAIGLRALALVSLVFVFANPMRVHRAPPEPGFGLDLVLAVDASGSMRSVDTHIGGERRSRLELARRVIARFAEDRASEGDRVALVVFGESTFTPCPLTSDGALLANALRRVEAGVAGEATAIGDALALAVKRALAGSSRSESDSPIAGRVVVLLTDGRNNAGRVPIEIAIALARGEGVRVHTVGIGTAGREVPVIRSGPETPNEMEFERHDVDFETLKRIAAETGGRFFPARSSEQLTSIYRDIDALERVARQLPPRVRHAPHPEPFLAFAGFCLLMEIGGTRVLRRRIP
jgi:Ca-activated chloride channel family protein